MTPARADHRADAPFLDAIRAAPQDDAPRLVYADWLDERGEAEAACEQRLAVCLKYVLADPGADGPRLAYARVCEQYGRHERAEIIRVSLPGGKRPTRERVGELWAWARDHLLGPLADRGLRGDLGRGFVEEVASSAADWLAHGDVVTAAHPIRQVELTTMPGEDFPVLEPDPDMFDVFLCGRWPRVGFRIPEPDEYQARR